MLLFVANTNLSHCIFTYANEKLICVFVRVFAKSDAMRPHFYKSSYRLENCHVTANLIYVLFAFALQIVSV